MQQGLGGPFPHAMGLRRFPRPSCLLAPGLRADDIHAYTCSPPGYPRGKIFQCFSLCENIPPSQEEFDNLLFTDLKKGVGGNAISFPT